MKGSNILWICLAACLIIPFMSLFVGNSVERNHNWLEYCTKSMWMSVLLLWPCIFGFLGSYIFTRERIENTYKNLLVIPIGRVSLMFSKLFVLLLTIVGMSLLTYILNFTGIFIGVKFSVNEFFIGIVTYLKSGVLSFIAILPVLLIAYIGKKGFLLSVCITFVYALVSFIGIWSPVLSSILPIVSILRICNISVLRITYSFPIAVNYIFMVVIALGSFVGIVLAAKRQEA